MSVSVWNKDLTVVEGNEMRCKHYFYFGEEVQKKMQSGKLECNGWEVLREQGDRNFSVDKSIEEFRNTCHNADSYAKMAKVTSNVLDRYGHNRVASLGIGKGIFEWHLKNFNPKLYVIGTDYTKQSIKLLRQVFTECDELKVFDMKNNSYRELGAECLIMYRVSTEFNYEDWCEIFEKMYNDGVQSIIFIPTELLNIKSASIEILLRLKNKIMGRKEIFCGYMYSLGDFKKIFSHGMWKIREEIPITANNTVIWYLVRKENAD
jgi:hypothetical protein